ncbi:MAG: molybdopterin molybdotransferase MoeA [Nitrososphaerales archaeon]
MNAKEDISFQEAYNLTVVNVERLGKELLSLSKALGRVCAEDIYATRSTPSADVSLKDGFAVRSIDVEGASATNPKRLRIIGSLAAGEQKVPTLKKGCAIKVTSGALLPKGAEAVVSIEFTAEHGDYVEVYADAEPGRNVLKKGSDLEAGSKIFSEGELLYPSAISLIAAGGKSSILVYRRPSVEIIATGSEVVALGKRVGVGKIVATNLLNIYSWIISLGLKVKTCVVKDEVKAIKSGLGRALTRSDVVLTIGGAWKSEKDIVVKMLDELGWKKIYHRVKMGPGKAIAFGLLGSKVVFCLPGGPPSNEMAFLQLVLPAVLKMCGLKRSVIPVIKAKLLQEVHGQLDWTQFVYGILKQSSVGLVVEPLTLKRRLQDMAEANCVFMVPEGVEVLSVGCSVDVQLLRPQALAPMI